jgi:hypothetical protein
VLRHFRAFLHPHTEELVLQVDSTGLLRSFVQRMEPQPCRKSFFTVVDDVAVLRVDLGEHQSERNVVGPDELVPDPRIRERRRLRDVDNVSY